MKETIIQFGEGNFLRGFVEDFVDRMNSAGLYDGKVVIVKPTPRGDLNKFDSQRCVYNLVLRGLENGEAVSRRKEIRCVSRCVNPYTDYEGYIALASQPELRFIISNTTEAGIAFDASDSFDDRPALSFPGKLTQLLYARFRLGLPGFVLLPCELIDDNGRALKECVLKYARSWELGEDFEDWVRNRNAFPNTLVDRIVTGYPGEEAADICRKIGRDDALLDTAEPYHLWAIEGDYENEFPLREAGVNVVWTDDISPLKKRKVRILNGAHTVTVFPALLYGMETVGDCMRDATVSAFLKNYLFGYALPLLGETEENLAFANAVLERFANPFIRHRLTSIALNSVSKFSVRVAPTAIDWYNKTGSFPKPAALSLAALIYYYKYRSPSDDPEITDFIRKSSVKEIVNADIWGADISMASEDVETAYGFVSDNKLTEAFILGRVVIDPRDNVEVSLENGQKYAIADIARNEAVIKYGYPIGYATADITAGEHVHTHNLRSCIPEKLDYEYRPLRVALSPEKPFVFYGYERKDGKVGLRNDIWIIPTVGCVNKIAERIARETGAFAFTHPYGCSQLGDDHIFTQKTLCGLIGHPNAGGVLVLGLGCENNRPQDIKEMLGEYDSERIRFLIAQDCEDEVAEGIRTVKELAEIAGRDKRTPVDASRLVVGLKCGGSDGLSGITANPMVGRITDRIVSMGGACVLTEVPEMFGAEHILMSRCVNEEVFGKTVSLINGFKSYYVSHGQPVGENPSPGNREGGITTLEEKSLGCVQKGGTAPVTDVLGSGDTVTKPGLNLLNGPGNDMVAVTNLAAAGCHMILFTTGRGTPLGAPVPTVKIATNTALAQKKSSWIDFDAQSGSDEELMDLIKRVACGEQTKNEVNGCREIAVFKNGVTL